MTNPSQPSGVFTSSFSSASMQSIYDDFVTFTPAQPTPTPLDPFTAASMKPHDQWDGLSGSYYFEDASHRTYFEDQRKIKRAYHIQVGHTPNWSYTHEFKLVDRLWRDWYDEPYTGPNNWTYEVLNLDGLENIPLRKFDLKPFKIDYDTLQEIKLRLNNTVISIKGHPFVVKSVRSELNGFKLAVYDGHKTYQVNYSDLTDLRSIPPMYVTSSSAGWLCRNPTRVYQQGLNRHNTVLKAVDGGSVLTGLHPENIVSAIRTRQKRKWDSTLASLMKGGELGSLRLSDDIAVRGEKGKVLACYRGRRLGFIQENEITVFDEDDLLQDWIEKPAKAAGLELRG